MEDHNDRALDLDALEKVARAATQGEWQHWGGLATCAVNAGKARVIGCDTDVRSERSLPESPYQQKFTENHVRPENAGIMKWGDAVHISTFDPPTVLRLISLSRPPVLSGGQAVAAEVVELVSDLRRKAKACRELETSRLSSLDKSRLRGKTLAYDHAADILAALPVQAGQGSGE